MADPEIFAQYPVASFQVAGSDPWFFAATNVRESYANRLVERERPYRDGAKIDDTGSKARRWQVTALFNSSVLEAQSGNQGVPLYPTAMNELLRLFDEHETGDLVLPTTGKVRARAASYEREEKFSERDEAVVTFTFVEDNEDRVDARAFAPPTVKASVVVLSGQTTFSAESDAVWDGSLADLNRFASQLEAIANYPGDVAQEIDSQSAIVVSATNRVLRAFTSESPRDKARSQLLDPETSATQRKLLALNDTAARARANLSPKKLVSEFVETPTTLFAIATRVNQDVEILIGLNPALDPLYVPKGTNVTVEG